MHLLCNFGFGLRNSALQVAATHAELDWNIAAVILVKDKRCPGLFDDLCHLLEGPYGLVSFLTGMLAIASILVRYWGEKRTTTSKRFSPSRTCVTACPPMA